MNYVDTEAMTKAAGRMQDAAERNVRAADQIEQAVQRLAIMLEDGYGGNGPRLIELLSKHDDEQAKRVEEARWIIENSVTTDSFAGRRRDTWLAGGSQ